MNDLENLLGFDIISGDFTLQYPNTITLTIIGITGIYPHSLSSTIIPNRYIYFTSEDSDVVTISTDGVISTFLGESGDITITASILGITQSIVVTVGSGIGSGYAMGPLGLTYAS